MPSLRPQIYLLTIYTIQRRKTYGYFEKKIGGIVIEHKIILAAAVILMTALLRELKNTEVDDE